MFDNFLRFVTRRPARSLRRAAGNPKHRAPPLEAIMSSGARPENHRFHYGNTMHLRKHIWFVTENQRFRPRPQDINDSAKHFHNERPSQIDGAILFLHNIVASMTAPLHKPSVACLRSDSVRYPSRTLSTELACNCSKRTVPIAPIKISLFC